MSSILKHLLSATIPPDSRILYLGDNGAKILPQLKPSYALVLYGASGGANDGAASMNIAFSSQTITGITISATFDYVVMDDVLPYMDDVFTVFRKVRELCHDDSKLIMSEVKKLTLFRRAVSLVVKSDKKIRNWIPEPLIETLLYLSDFCPRPKVDSCIIADAREVKTKREYSYSIMIPCYNEEGNIAECIRRIPDLERDYEVIVVNDGSSDRTAEVVNDLARTDSRLRLIDYRENRGKGYATMCGLNAATKDVLIILDADMTVRPEDLPLFIAPFESRHAEFVNGTRLVYPLADKAMGPVHMFGNKVFSVIFSYLLNQKVTDTLCGTKCLFRKDYRRMAMKDEAWPDFDLLFGASLLNLKIVEVPIWYQPRVSGESKMKTVKHGCMLLKASFIGLLRLKLRIGTDQA
jgi:glycosyl transferase family 2